MQDRQVVSLGRRRLITTAPFLLMDRQAALARPNLVNTPLGASGVAPRRKRERTGRNSAAAVRQGVPAGEGHATAEIRNSCISDTFWYADAFRYVNEKMRLKDLRGLARRSEGGSRGFSIGISNAVDPGILPCARLSIASILSPLTCDFTDHRLAEARFYSKGNSKWTFAPPLPFRLENRWKS
ncbi:hypothetical protein EV130_102681 [Rhizobium azibense]|uniref:Uncharacterized protein n=1 Tax=Rhizobium azibense TaxID=1136135 RepID=A0A4R3R3A0_9HYPH|nr:hypothetical protein EV130_102681 [Rhizobium azibense]